LRGIASFTDYFIVMSADSSRLIQALETEISRTMKESKLNIHRREGSAVTGWILMDCSDVIVHIFAPEEREFFGLERLWARAPQVVRILSNPNYFYLVKKEWAGHCSAHSFCLTDYSLVTIL
ncbi:MAG: ribosome silencing factor, partial [Chloroflexota bacterium]|nr:ribosome silencing factor [Chloroflexota bacterium]